MARQIVISIDPKGLVDVEAFGFKGGACATETAKLLEALGGTVVMEKKPEFNEKCNTVSVGAQVKA